MDNRELVSVKIALPTTSYEICLLLSRRRYELGYSQAQIAQRVGIKQPQINRIESCESTPRNKERVKAIYSAYQLDNVDPDGELLDRMYDLWVGYRSRAEDVFEITSLSDFLGSVNEDLIRTQQEADGGLPILASQHLHDKILPDLRRVQQLALNDRRLRPKISDIQEYLSHALWQYGRTFTNWQPRPEAAGNLRNVAEDLDRIAEHFGQALPIALAHSLRTSAYYLLDDFVASADSARMGLAIVETGHLKEADLCASFLQLQAISQAKLLNVSAKTTASNIEDMLMKGDISSVQMWGGLETIARIECVLGTSDFWQKLDMAKKEVARPGGGYVDNYVGLLLIRAEIEAMRILNEPDSSHLDELLKEAALISGENLERLRRDILEETHRLRSGFE